MNKSKITALTAIATVMSASSAYADLSLSGAIGGKVQSGDDHTGVNHATTTSSIYVSYSSTLDNGMGMSAGFSSTATGNNYSIGIDTGMGSVNFGETHSSAVDVMDGMPAGVNTITSTASLGDYSDGDSEEGMGIRYTSPSFNGFTVGVSMGDNVTTDRVSTMAVKGSVAGVAVAAGKVDQAGVAGDDTFMTLGYSVAGVSLGYGNYDSDGDGESTVLGLNTSFAGLNLGFEQEDWDGGTATDQDQTSFSVNKDLGGMGVTLIYTDTDDGTGVDDQNWTLYYSVGF
jgi:predicted porin